MPGRTLIQETLQYAIKHITGNVRRILVKADFVIARLNLPLAKFTCTILSAKESGYTRHLHCHHNDGRRAF
jgi:hypothetical protein